MKIERVTKSRFSDLDIDNVGFGKTFTDHMLYCRYANGAWSEPIIKPFQNISLSPAAQILHYGQSIFEGMKAYKDSGGNTFLFRPNKNLERFNISALRMAMPEISAETFIGGIKELLKLEKQWIPTKEGLSLYIRPHMYATEPIITARASNEYDFIIFCSVVNSYYSKPLSVKIETEYSRAANGGIGLAKTGGNYAGSFFPTIQAQKEGYDQVIWTDASTHELIEEAGTMNVFFRIGNELITTPSSDTILNGVTRDSILTLAKDKEMHVSVKRISVQEILQELEKGNLKEAFGVGTAVIVNHFHNIGYKGKDYKIPVPDFDQSMGLQLKKALVDIQLNNAPDPFGWRNQV